MKNKQTAIEWFFDKLENHEIQAKHYDLFQQAKQMEKEQNREFYNEGKDFSSYTHDATYGGVEYWDREPMRFEQYYNETYEK